MRLFEKFGRDKKAHRSGLLGRNTEAVLALLAIGPPAFALLELSTPMLLSRAPTRAELYAAYRYRRPLIAAGAAAGAALFRRAFWGEGTARPAKMTAVAMGALAASVQLIYDPLLFNLRKTGVRIRRAEEAGDIFEGDDTEVFGVRLNGEARAYPARKGARPHLITDTLGGEPILVSYCGLTNSAIIYRAKDGQEAPELSVVSAPNNNILYWEARTGSLVQQLLPEITYGPGAGRPLHTLPVVYTTWETWYRMVPETTLADQPYSSLRDRLITRMMRREHMRMRAKERPFLAVAGGTDRTVHRKARVFALLEGGEAKAYTRNFLEDLIVVNDDVGGQPVEVFYDPESDIAMAYRRELEGQRLAFRPASGGGFEDEETGTRWDVLGRAISGPYAGRSLDTVPFSFDKAFCSLGNSTTRTPLSFTPLASAVSWRPRRSPRSLGTSAPCDGRSAFPG